MLNILGINLSVLKPAEVWLKINQFINGDKQNYVVTPNPEIILAANQDEELFYILNQANLAIADGFGLKLAGLLLTGQKIPRLTGADLTVQLLDLAAKKQIKIAVLNWRGGLSKQTDIIKILRKRYPKLTFLIRDISREKYLNSETITELNNFAPRILFVSLGFPYQEKLIYHNLKKIPSLRLALGIGGSFDFITNRIKRAPRLMRYLGLEWLWRLISANKYPQSQKRRKRIYQAVFVFSFKIFKSRFIYPWCYRPNVVCCLYQKKNDKIEVLLVERKDEKNHWQLPQGGTDGQSLEEAGHRELVEELNTDKFCYRGSFKKLWKYKFGPHKPGSRAYQRNYKGQKQGLYIAEFQGQTDDIKLNFWDHTQYKWVAIDEVVNKVHPLRKKSTKIFLDKLETLVKK